MENKNLEIKTKIQISKSVNEVFEAIVNPAKMSNYFIAKSSGRMEEGKTLIWNFPEFDVDVPIVVGKVEKDNYVSYNWDAEDGSQQLVEIYLEDKNHSTIITIIEKGMPNSEAGIKWLKSNTEGWANFLACLKAYLEYGINLRKGAFDFMKKN